MNECFIQRSENALTQAKINIMKHFLVVGTLERMDDSLKVIQGKIPRLNGILDLYREKHKIRKYCTATKVVRTMNAWRFKLS